MTPREAVAAILSTPLDSREFFNTKEFTCSN